MGRTLLDKIWYAHQVSEETPATPGVLYVDLHLVHESLPQAFSNCARGLPVRRPKGAGDVRHSTPTLPADASGKRAYVTTEAESQVAQLEANTKNSAYNCTAGAARTAASST
jgi:3-isopropylmalate/(R)-2-methylmalate dehydratase large subunit